ncbi:hypothetical protein niasHT_017032 [Heterodera trifolii]|uniref:Uncharacterized protein n=1 Tax=Heterodera trifolii TaxID=157864 RepID=A0ABD2KZ03_9BILA
MSCNPCCCLKLKDAAISIGIWSTIYSIMQLAIFGWQMAAIKYEKDRAANTLLPNYNTYGRYDIPTYYESYWQSPEERYYSWLFVIQILCLIAAFFLLFASIMMIYGVHTWSRFLLVPWMVTMCASILTSFAYCLIWWAGDVRDYWLLLTIVEMFGVLLNVYCFLVIIMFHRRMLVELEYYARRRKYDRFSQLPRETAQQQRTERAEMDRTDPRRSKETALPCQRPATESQWPYQSPHQPGAGAQLAGDLDATTNQRPKEMADEMHTARQLEQRHQKRDSPIILPHLHQIRSLSAMERPPQKSQFDEYGEMPRRDRRRRPTSHRKKSTPCGMCHRDQSLRRCHCCHASKHCHWHGHSAERHHKGSFSSSSSNSALGEYSAEELPTFGRRTSRKGRRSRRKRSRERARENTAWSDRESEISELGHTVRSEREYGNIGSLERQWTRPPPRMQFPTFEGRRRQQQQQSSRKGEPMPRADSASGTLSLQPQPILAPPPPAGIAIPQHIVIPPAQIGARASETLDSRAERKYRINSEITVSYDPKYHPPQANGQLTRRKPPEIPPRTFLSSQSLSPHSAGYINLSTNAPSVLQLDGRREPRPNQKLISMHSNV